MQAFLVYWVCLCWKGLVVPGVKFHKNCDHTGKIPKNLCVRCNFVKFYFYFLGLGLWEIFFRCNYTWFITSLALEKCKKECNMLQIILVQEFCPLKIKITQCPGGFHLNLLVPIYTPGWSKALWEWNVSSQKSTQCPLHCLHASRGSVAEWLER